MALNAAQAKRLGLNFRYEGDPTQVQTASGLVNAYLVKLKSVRVGDIEVKDVRAFVIDGAYPTTVLLGMSFLERVDLQRTGEVMLIRKKY
jgi:aspartyl protease family protein